MIGLKKWFSSVVGLLLILNIGILVLADENNRDSAVTEINIFDEAQYQLSDDISTMQAGDEEFDISNWTIEDVAFDEPQDLSEEDLRAFNESDPQPLSTSNYPNVVLADMQHDRTDGYPDSPFPSNHTVTIMYRILNYGDSELQNIRIDYYFGRAGRSLSYLGNTSVGRLPGKTYTIARVGLNSGGAVGTHTFAAQIHNSTLSSNRISSNFLWGGETSPSNRPTTLCAYSMQLVDKKYDFATMEQKEISLEVANLSDQDLSNVDVDIKITSNHGIVEHIQRQYNLPAHHAQPFVVQFKIRKQGNYTFTFQVDPNNKQPDTDRSDNMLFEKYSVDFDVHFLSDSHVWSKANEFNVYIDNDLIKNDFTQEDIKGCFLAWNGISSKVNFSPNNFHFVSKDEFHPVQGDIYVKLTDTNGLNNPNLRGVTVGNTRYNIVNNKINYSWISINDDVFYTQNESATGQTLKTLQTKTLTHEVGHALGLAHPCTDPERPEQTGCGDRAIMWQTSNLDYVEYSVQPHDEWNLIKRYK